MWHFADARGQHRVLEGWDDEFKYPYPEETEWVPTHELRKFMEYDRRPGGLHSDGDIERWNALSDHIKQNGFANPVILDFNPDTGHAYMSEGNHRTQIALDAGIPAMPVRVYRSRRTSPTQIPVNAIAQPEWENHRGDTHWPSNMKPSHIGLPTVPAPTPEADNNQTLSRTAGAIDIVEGQTQPSSTVWQFSGRPETHRPALYTEVGGRPTVYLGQGGTHHADLAHEFGLAHTNDWAYIDTEGPYDHNRTFPAEAMQELKRYISEQYGTQFDKSDDWTF